jgi:putative endonuclease
VPYAYLLECADGTLYAGWTTDLARRVAAHNRGAGARYTRGRRPVRLVYFEESATREAAMQREAALRRLSRKQKLEAISAQRSTVSDQPSTQQAIRSSSLPEG